MAEGTKRLETSNSCAECSRAVRIMARAVSWLQIKEAAFATHKGPAIIEEMQRFIAGNKPPADETCDQLTDAQANAIATSAVQNVCELPDYNSPDDQPELLQCTVTQLHHCVMSAIEANVSETPDRCLASGCGERPMRAAFCAEHNDAIPLEDREDMVSAARRSQQITHCECAGCRAVRKQEGHSEKANSVDDGPHCTACGRGNGRHHDMCPVQPL